MTRCLPLLAALLMLPAAASAGSKPDELAERVTRDGAAPTVAALVAKHKWHRVLGHIGTGKPDWLGLAPKLAAGTDAATGPELTRAVADALLRNAGDALDVIAGGKGPLAPAAVCSAPYVKPLAGDLKAYREKARRAIEAVTALRLHEVRRACLTALRDKAGGATG